MRTPVLGVCSFALYLYFIILLHGFLLKKRPPWVPNWNQGGFGLTPQRDEALGVGKGLLVTKSEARL